MVLVMKLLWRKPQNTQFSPTCWQPFTWPHTCHWQLPFGYRLRFTVDTHCRACLDDLGIVVIWIIPMVGYCVSEQGVLCLACACARVGRWHHQHTACHVQGAIRPMTQRVNTYNPPMTRHNHLLILYHPVSTDSAALKNHNYAKNSGIHIVLSYLRECTMHREDRLAGLELV